MKRTLFGTVAGILVAGALSAGEPVDWEMVGKIRDEGFNRSQVMEVMEHLTDGIGPRLTGSPAMREANEWTRDKLSEWGLANAALEAWGPFGRGWDFSRATAHMIEPFQTPLMALPKAWTSGTNGPIRAAAVFAPLQEEDDFEKHTGELAGKIVLTAKPREFEPNETPAFRRYSEEQLDDLTEFNIPGKEGRDARLKRYKKRVEFAAKRNQFLRDEDVLAVVDISSRAGGTLRLAGGGSRDPEAAVAPPTVALMAEQYNWIVRLLESERRVELELDIAVRFYDDDLQAYNTVAEIPGSDRTGETVMVGAHLDSWHAGHGANDNAAGVAVAMEAVRILRALEVAPKRTIRIGLWSAEEQGLLGSQAYVSAHMAARPEPKPEERYRSPMLWEKRFPLTVKPAHAKLSAYFNLDNGSGKIRGIYTQDNPAVVPIFSAWLEPLHDLGADTVTNRTTGGTDHLAFDRVGLPGFQFIQDGLDYFSRTHHSNLDTFDHAQPEDLKQAAVVMATFLYHAAMRDEKLPRKPMPRAPEPSSERETGP